MNNLHPNIINLELAAKQLKQIKQELVYVGGATAILYVDDLESANPRATIDVDCVVEVSSLGAFHNLEEELRQIGFKNDTSDNAPICRWKKGSLIIDLMPTDEKILGFSNPWYKEGFKNSEKVKLPSAQEIKIFSFPYFVASKLEALINRGFKDLLTSQDLEDVLFVIEGRQTFFEELKTTNKSLQNATKKIFSQLIRHADFDMAVRGNFPRDINLDRQNLLISKMREFSR